MRCLYGASFLIDPVCYFELFFWYVQALGRISEFLEQQPSPFTRLENLNLELESDEVPRTVVSYFVNGSADSRIKVLNESGGIQFSVPIEIH